MYIHTYIYMYIYACLWCVCVCVCVCVCMYIHIYIHTYTQTYIVTQIGHRFGACQTGEVPRSAINPRPSFVYLKFFFKFNLVRYQEAHEHLKVATAKLPESPSASIEMGLCLMGLGNTQVFLNSKYLKSN